MRRPYWLLCTLALHVSPAAAAAITVSGDEPRTLVTLEADNATVDSILEDLAAKYGFQIKGQQNAGAGEPLSAKMSGRLDQVLARLLRNRNYMIVRSPDNGSGIEAIMILDASYGAGPSKAVQNPGAQAEDLMQALSNGNSD